MKSKLIIGTAQFGLAYGINNQKGLLAESEVTAILNFATKNNACYLDTAAAYGLSEQRIGNHIKNTNQQFKIITKFKSTPNLNLFDSIDNSLSKLNTNQIETILFHSLKAYQTNIDNLEYFIKSSKQRRFKKLGVSVYDNIEALALVNDEKVEVVQLPFNLFDNELLRAETIKKLKLKRKEIHTRSVFLQGVFFMKNEQIPEHLKHLKPSIDKVQKISNNNNLKLGHLALQYALQKEYIDGVLIGVDSLEQFKQNIEWANQSIPKNVFTEIDSIHIKDKELLNPSLWKI